MLANTDDEVTVYDALTYAGNLVDPARRRRRPALPVREGQHLRPARRSRRRWRGHDAVVHFAAESHVDRSIVGPDDFVNTNCFGTNIVMDTARRLEIGAGRAHRHRRGLRLGRGRARRRRPTRSSPARRTRRRRRAPTSSRSSYHHTYGLPVVVTRCTNNFGPYQFPEKVIPLFTTNLLDGKQVPLYGDGLNERDWLYVDDHCAGVAPRAAHGATGRDLQHRRRQRDAEPRARRQAARAARRGRGDGRVRRPTASATTAATRSTSPRSPRSAGASSARSTRRSRRPSPGTATTAGGGSRSRRHG